MPFPPDNRKRRAMNIILSLPDDIPADLKRGRVYQLAPIMDDDGDVIGYWIFDENENPVVVVSASSVTITEP